MILMSTMGFSGMPYLVMWPEIIFDIALVVKIQDGRYLFNFKLEIDIILNRVDTDSLFCCLP